MEFESRSKGGELGFPHALRQVQVTRQRKQRGEVQFGGAGVVAGMVGGWPEAKTVAVEVQVEVGRFARAGWSQKKGGGNGAGGGKGKGKDACEGEEGRGAGGSSVGSVVLVIR